MCTILTVAETTNMKIIAKAGNELGKVCIMNIHKFPHTVLSKWGLHLMWCPCWMNGLFIVANLRCVVYEVWPSVQWQRFLHLVVVLRDVHHSCEGSFRSSKSQTFYYTERWLCKQMCKQINFSILHVLYPLFKVHDYITAIFLKNNRCLIITA